MVAHSAAQSDMSWVGLMVVMMAEPKVETWVEKMAAWKAVKTGYHWVENWADLMVVT